MNQEYEKVKAVFESYYPYMARRTFFDVVASVSPKERHFGGSVSGERLAAIQDALDKLVEEGYIYVEHLYSCPDCGSGLTLTRVPLKKWNQCCIECSETDWNATTLRLEELEHDQCYTIDADEKGIALAQLEAAKEKLAKLEEE